VFPTQTLAQNSRESTTRASDCDSLARACTGAARELIAARNLIKGYEQHIAAADERINVARLEIENLKRTGDLHTARAVELENVIAAEREAVKLLLKRIQLQQERITSLEKQLGRARKFSLIAGVAAAVGILISIAK
jgi:chromosome segregation ATPase